MKYRKIHFVGDYNEKPGHLFSRITVDRSVPEFIKKDLTQQFAVMLPGLYQSFPDSYLLQFRADSCRLHKLGRTSTSIQTCVCRFSDGIHRDDPTDVP